MITTNRSPRIDTELLHLIVNHPLTSTDTLIELSRAVPLSPALSKEILAHDSCSAEVITEVLANHLASQVKPPEDPTSDLVEGGEETPEGQVVIETDDKEEEPAEEEQTDPGNSDDNTEQKSRGADTPQQELSVIEQEMKVWELIENARTSKSSAVLRELLTNERLDVKLTALANPHCSLGSLREYGSANQSAIRRQVAMNSKCPPELLETLVRDRSATVRRAAINNPKAPSSAVLIAAQGKDTELHQIAAHHPNAEAEALTILTSYTNEVSNDVLEDHSEDTLPAAA